MKPIQIGLFVLVGAMGGALIMKVMQRPKPAPAPVVAVAPAPVVPQPAPSVPAAQEAAAPEEKPSAFDPAPAPQAKPVRKAHRPIITVAQNVLPAQPPKQVAAPPAPEPVREPSIPAPAAIEEPPAAAPAPAAPAEQEAEPPAPEPAPSVTLQTGLQLTVRLGENLSSEHNLPGDTFTATLDAPVSAGGFVIAERGARVEGRIVDAQKASRTKGQASLSIELTRLTTSDGQRIPIQTEAFRKQAVKTTGDDVGVVAAAAGIGAVIGAIAGGGRGAAIGAGAGGAAGVGGVAATKGKAISLPTETRISFRLKEPVTITERPNR